MNNKELSELIRRYKAGTATEDELRLIKKLWSDAEPEVAQVRDHTQTELQRLGQEMFVSIQNRIKHSEKNARALPISRWAYKVAATVLILMSAGLWWYTASDNLNEIRTGFGERRTVLLPDQSTVVLNGNSFLRYAPQWDENAPREIWIEGEGFFSVRHTASHQKFVVYGSRQLNVEVLGTKFNIKSRECTAEVVLTEGKLKVAIEGAEELKEVFLKPGELATVNDRKLSTRNVKYQKYTSWMDNKLILERTSLKDLATVLKETYGLTVTFETSELESRTLSGEISSATSDDILLAISQTLDLKAERDGNEVRISIIAK